MVAELLDAVSCHQCIEADNCQLNAQNVALKKENLELHSKLRSERFARVRWKKMCPAAGVLPMFAYSLLIILTHLLK